MKYIYLSIILLLLFSSCANGNRPAGIAYSNSPTEFSWKPTNTDVLTAQIESDQLAGNDCLLTAKEVAGETALEVRTDREFCDAIMNAEPLFGRKINVKESRYLTIRLYLPAESWITAIKLNFRDSLGNFGGIGEVVNNFYGHYDQWLDVLVDLQTLLPNFKNWHGEECSLSAVTQFSLNPYCAHQADSSSFYVSQIELSNERPVGEFHQALIAPPPVVENGKYLFTFDDPAELRRQMAYRTFESSGQALRNGVAGNESMAICLRGKPELNNIAWLPIISAVTGRPADFTKVKRIYFDYFLQPGGDVFDGSTLYLTSEHWNDILIDTNFYDGFVAGRWQSVSIDLDDLKLVRVKGENDVLSNIHELRMNLNFRPGKKNIEMWLDNFGWE